MRKASKWVKAAGTKRRIAAKQMKAMASSREWKKFLERMARKTLSKVSSKLVKRTEANRKKKIATHHPLVQGRSMIPCRASKNAGVRAGIAPEMKPMISLEASSERPREWPNKETKIMERGMKANSV